MAVQDAVIALFCGAGGMSLGFRQAGMEPLVGVDSDPDACHTYAANLATEVLQSDLSAEDPRLARLLDGIRQPLAIIGGPPCQGFSSAGGKNRDDRRNRLIFHYLALVARLKPRWFLFENVEGLLTANGGQSLVDLVQECIRIGYRVRLEKVNFASFGLPQARKRVILMGNCIGVDFAFPPATHSFNAGKHKSRHDLPLAPTLAAALQGLGAAVTDRDELSLYSAAEPLNPYDALMREGNHQDAVSLHVASVPPAIAAMLAQLQPGQSMKDLPPEYWHRSFVRRAFRRVIDGTPTEKRGGAPSGIKRLVGDLNALTITSAAIRALIHPVEPRPLTLREAARLQSFPDAYGFFGSTMSMAHQIGNAFPPLAARIFAERILALDGAFGADAANPTQAMGSLAGYHLTDAAAMSPALMRTQAMLAAILASRPRLFPNRLKHRRRSLPTGHDIMRPDDCRCAAPASVFAQASHRCRSCEVLS
ncbi:MAG: DNA cytosine methyltransferase [Oscillochloris sp.]|nr:DNA cytosine methyltransferase [Oscillochloris sp.]